MSKLVIYEDTNKAGEGYWHLRLVDEDGKTLLCSETPLQKVEMLSVAKKVQHESSNAAFFNKESEKIEEGIWFESCQNKDNEWCIRLKMAEGHVFTTTTSYASKEDLEKLLAHIKQEIKKTRDKEIAWDPPEADPAKSEKDSDQTETLGIPGEFQGADNIYETFRRIQERIKRML